MLPPRQNAYRIVSPPRVVGCTEYGCRNQRMGWRTILPADQAGRIRTLRGYSYTEEAQDGGLIAFTFPPGQECFIGRAGMHRLPAEGRERFIQRGRGDMRPDDWVDSFANNQIAVARMRERG